MARARLRVCGTTGCPRLQPQPRCPEHQAALDRHYRRTTPTKATLDHQERRRRALTVARWRAAHGDWCPGWGRPAHHSADLTAEHIDSIGKGGDPRGTLGVLCRGCNSRKG